MSFLKFYSGTNIEGFYKQQNLFSLEINYPKSLEPTIYKARSRFAVMPKKQIAFCNVSKPLLVKAFRALAVKSFVGVGSG